MGKAKEILDKFNVVNEISSATTKLIDQIKEFVFGSKLDGPKFTKATGALHVLGRYIEKERGISDTQKKVDFMSNAKEKDLPSFEDIKKFMLGNKKLLNIK